MRYFAYGSNMDPRRMKKRGVEFTSREWACLKGWRLEFNKEASSGPGVGYANIVEDKDGVVEGILYEITEEGLYKLDDYEVCPDHYARIQVGVVLKSGEGVEANTYVAQPDWVSEGLKPTRDYIQHLLAGCDLLSHEYCERLRNWELLDSE